MLSQLTKIIKSSIRTTIKRIRNDEIIAIIPLGKGRGSKIQIELSRSAYAWWISNHTQALKTENTDTIPTQNPREYRHNTDTTPDTNGPSSSSFSIYKETTTELENQNDEWSKIQTPEILKKYHFGKGIITQVMSRNLLSPGELQESLNAFAFDIEENKVIQVKKIRNATSYFMKIMNSKSPYLPPGNYKSDEEKAMDEILQRTEEKAKKIKEREKRLLEANYTIWTDETSREEIEKAVPADMFQYMGEMHSTQVKDYFVKAIWPEEKTKLSSIDSGDSIH